MTLDVIETVWEALKFHFNTVDLAEAADDMVGILVDVHGYDPEDIREAFKHHPAVKSAIKHYLTEHLNDQDPYSEWAEDSDDNDDLNFDDYQ